MSRLHLQLVLASAASLVSLGGNGWLDVLQGTHSCCRRGGASDTTDSRGLACLAKGLGAICSTPCTLDGGMEA